MSTSASSTPGHASRPSLHELADADVEFDRDSHDDSGADDDYEREEYEEEAAEEVEVPIQQQQQQQQPRPSTLHDATSAVSDIYTHLALSSSSAVLSSSASASAARVFASPPAEPVRSWQHSSTATHRYTSGSAHNSSSGDMSQLDVLLSPQPNPSAPPRPHTQPSTSSSASTKPQQPCLDEQFIEARGHSQLAGKKAAPESKEQFHPSARSSGPPPSFSPQSSQTRSSLHTSSRAQLLPSTLASASVRVLDSNVSRMRWLENKRFVLASLKHALSSKQSEVGERMHSLAGDRLACEQKLVQTLEAYIKRTNKSLQGYLKQIADLDVRIERTSGRVDAEIQRFDVKAVQEAGRDSEGEEEEKTNEAHPTSRVPSDPQVFDAISSDLESEIQSILASIHASGNFSLDASAIPSFDPFQVERIKRVEKENAELRERLNTLQLQAGVGGGVDSASLSSTLKRTGAMPHNETQELIGVLQNQLDELTQTHLTLKGEHDRLKNDHASALHSIKHDRLSVSQQQSAHIDQVSALQESLRLEQQSAHNLQKQFEKQLHEVSLLSSSLATEQAAHTRAVLEAQGREKNFLGEMESLRLHNQREFEERNEEIKTLHQRIQQMQAEHASQRSRSDQQSQSSAEQSLSQMHEQHAREKAELENRIKAAKMELERSIQCHQSEVKKLQDESSKLLSKASDESNARSLEANNALSAAKHECNKLQTELERSRRELTDCKAKHEAERAAKEHQHRLTVERLEKEEQRCLELSRALEQLSAESKNLQKANEGGRELQTDLKRELEELKLKLVAAEEKVRSLTAEKDAMKRSIDRDERRRVGEEEKTNLMQQQLAEASVKASSLQLELDLSQAKAEESLRSLSSEKLALEKREAEAQQKIAALEREVTQGKQQMESNLSRMDVQLNSLQSHYNSAKARISSLLESAESERQRFSALESSARESGMGELEKMKKSMDLQIEIGLARFIAQHKDRLVNIMKAIQERLMPLPSHHHLDSEQAAMNSLRQAVSGSGSGVGGSRGPSNEDALHDSMRFDFLAASSLSAAAQIAPSLPATKLQFESLIGQLETGITTLFDQAVTQRQKAAERYQSMLVALKRQSREQLQQSESEAASLRDQIERQHASSLRELETEYHSKLATLSKENESLTQQFHEFEAESRQELERTCREYEEVLEQERAAAENHCAALLMQAKEEHVHDARLWEAEKDSFLQSRSQREAEIDRERRETTDTHEKVLRALREERERMQSQLDEIDQSTRATISNLSETHQANLQENLSLMQRKHDLELQVLRAEFHAQHNELKLENEEKSHREEKEARQQMEALESQYVAQLERLQSEHDEALRVLTDKAIAQREEQLQQHASIVASVQTQNENTIRDLLVAHQLEIEELCAELNHRQNRTVQAIQSCLGTGIGGSEFDASREREMLQYAARREQEELRAYEEDEDDRARGGRMDVLQQIREEQAKILAEANADNSSFAQEAGADALYSARSNYSDASAASHRSAAAPAEAETPAALRTHRSTSTQQTNASTNSSSTGGGGVSASTGSTSSSKSTSRLSKTALKLSAAAAARHDEELAALQSQLLTSNRAHKERVKNLQLQLAQCERQKDRLIVEMEERLQNQIVDLRAKESITKAKWEECSSNLAHAKEYNESLSARWKALSEAHDELQAKHTSQEQEQQQLVEKHATELRLLTDRFQVQVAELQTEVVDAEYKVHKTLGNAEQARAALIDAHAAEKKSLLEQHAQQLQEQKDAFQRELATERSQHELALQSLKSHGEKEKESLRKSLEEAHRVKLAQLTEKYESILRIHEQSMQQQQAAMRALEANVQELHVVIDGHDSKLHDLHRAHLVDLQRRLEKWRQNRLDEIREDEEFLRLKMDSIKQTYLRREETLCKSCKIKLGATSFRAALNRLCEEASQPQKYRTLHDTAMNASQQQEKQPEAIHYASSPISSAASSSASSISTPLVVSSALSASARSSRTSTLPVSSSSSSSSPAVVAAKYAAAPAHSTPSQLSQSARASSSSVSASSPAAGDAAAAVGVSHYAGAAPVSKQEGVLTLRFHPSAASSATAAAPTHEQQLQPESPLITSSLSFTPAPAPSSSPTSAAPLSANTYQSMLDQYLNKYAATKNENQ